MQKGLVIEHIQQFQKLILRVEGIADDKLLDLFIGTLKDNIQHEVRLFEPTSLEKADVVLGVQWLQSLGMVDFNFLEFFMKFSLDGKKIEY